MTRKRRSERDLGYVKATMKLEGLNIPDNTLSIYRKYLNKEYTSDEARNIILKKHSLKKV